MYKRRCMDIEEARVSISKVFDGLRCSLDNRCYSMYVQFIKFILQFEKSKVEFIINIIERNIKDFFPMHLV